MKVLIVCVLGWATVALTKAAAPPEKPVDDKTEKSDLVKRYLFCHHGWTKINGACFKYVSKPLSWARAETMGAHLASVQSKKEYKKIQKLTAPYGNRETWIGASDAQEVNFWLWIDGEKFVYTNWCKGEPSNYKGSQHCLTMNHTAKKCWDDVGCNFRLPSICARRGWGLVG